MPPTPRKKRGRPRKKIDVGLVERLARIHCTIPEIASVLQVSISTISTRFSKRIIPKAREAGKASLRREMWRHAKRGNTRILLHLARHWLGEHDQTKTTVQVQGGIDWDKVATGTPPDLAEEEITRLKGANHEPIRR